MSGPNQDAGRSNSSAKTTAEPEWYEGSGGNLNVDKRLDRNQDVEGTAVGGISRDLSIPDGNYNKNTMVGRNIEMGGDSFTIKNYIKCKGNELFVLECEKTRTGYSDKCPICQQYHGSLSASHGLYVEAADIYKTLGQQGLEKERSKGRQHIEKLKKIGNHSRPLKHAVTGSNKGIEGNSNSCYMDSTIFCMFAYSDVFDSLLNMNVDKECSLLALQTLLRENIVNLLRSEEGFVESDALYHLRALLSAATGDQSFNEMEKDPAEFLRALERLFHYAPLKTIAPDQEPNQDESNIITNIMWEMFDANPEKLKSTSIASIFRNSLREVPAKLATIPPFLILVAPRHARSQRSYRYIVPDHQITLDYEIVQHVCLKCQRTNHDPDQARDFYFCTKCYSKNPSSIPSPSIKNNVMCYCRACLEELHKSLSDAELSEHYPKPMKSVAHKLNLFAVLCIETSHYVAFVKCRKADQKHQWVFFDSMSDQLYDQKNVPRVSRVSDLDEWIKEAEDNKDYFDDLDRRRNQGKPTSQAFNESEMRRLRLFRDGAFFFYENAEASYQ